MNQVVMRAGVYIHTIDNGYAVYSAIKHQLENLEKGVVRNAKCQLLAIWIDCLYI